jgi:Family of unknown function (DUF5329)
MRPRFCSPLICVTVVAATTAPLLPQARAKVDRLMSKLEVSGCDFYGNGSWHTRAEAKTPLLRKLNYLEEKNLVQTTEQFIELAASTSSISGQPYLVRCETPLRSRAACGSSPSCWLSGRPRRSGLQS